MKIINVSPSNNDTSRITNEGNNIAVQDNVNLGITVLSPIVQRNLLRALYLGSLELAENLIHPITLLVLSKKSTSATLFEDVGLLAPSLLFRMLSYIPLSHLLPMAKEAHAQPSVKASVYFIGVIYAAVMAIIYPRLYQYYDGTRLTEFSQLQLHAMYRLNNAQRIDIISQLVRVILIDNSHQRPLLMLTMLAGITQISYIAAQTNPNLEDYVTGVQINSGTRLLLLSINTLPLLRRINIPFAEYCINMRDLSRSAGQLIRRSVPGIIQKLIVFNIVSTAAKQYHKYHLIGVHHILVSLADLIESFIRGMAIESQGQIAKTYQAEPTHAARMGQQVIVEALLLSSLMPLLYAAVTYYNDKNDMAFFVWMGFINMLFTIEHIGETLINGINFNFTPNVINSAVSFMVPYALLNLDKHSSLHEFSIATVLQVVAILKTCVVLGTWMLRMRHLTRNQHEITRLDQPYARQIDDNSISATHPDIESPSVTSIPVPNLDPLRNASYRVANHISSLFYWREPRPTAASSAATVELRPNY